MRTAANVPSTLESSYMVSVSLSGFVHFRTILFPKPSLSEPNSLPSLRAPLSDHIATIVFLGSLICTSTTLMMLRGKLWNAADTLPLLVSGMIGQSFGMAGNSRFLAVYTIWLLLTCFISITYTKILQSIVIVPATHYNVLSFEEMARRNYTFECENWKWMKERRMMMDNDWVFLSVKEELMSQLVSPKGHGMSIGFTDYYSERTKRVLVDSKKKTRPYELVSQIGGWGMVMGKEQFFSVPTWWVFAQIERASLITSSVEILKEVGLVSYFLQLSASRYRESVVAGYQQKKVADSIEAHTVPLKDAVTTECFLLFVYGAVMTIAVFLVEWLTTVLIRTYKAHL